MPRPRIADSRPSTTAPGIRIVSATLPHRRAGRASVEYGAGFQRELVVGNVRGAERARGSHVEDRRLESLLGQCIHQVQVEIDDTRGPQLLDRTVRVVRRMNASQALESRRGKR